MYLFKKSFSFLFFLSTAVVLGACSGQEKQDIDLNLIEGNSPFRVNQIKGESRVVYKKGLPAEFILDLNTCIKDSIRKDISLQDIPFTVEYKTSQNGKITKENVKVYTNEDGCIIWSERYEYKYVTKPLWIGLERTIKKEKGAYAGQVFVRTAINPWSLVNTKAFPSIMDLRPLYYKNNVFLKQYTYVKEGLEFLTDKKLEYPQLWASHMDVQIDLDGEKEKKQPGNLIKKYQNICHSEKDSNCFSRKLSMSITIPLELRILGTESQLVDIKINGGVYNVKVQLISQYPKGSDSYYRIHEKVLTLDNLSMGNENLSSQRTKFLSANFKLQVPYINNNSNNKMIIEIESKNLPFKKFQGVYTLGKIDLGVVNKYNIDSSLDEEYRFILNEKYKNDKTKTVNIIERMNIKYVYESAQNALQSSAGKTEVTNKQIESRLNDKGFYRVELDTTVNSVRFSNIKNNEVCSTNETVVKRTIQYIGTVCFKDFLDISYQKTAFKIFRQDLDSQGSLKKEVELFKEDKGKSNYSTDANSCITWSDEIEHKNYDRQIYYSRVMHFISEDLGLYGRATIAINPWQEAFQFYQDITQLSQDKIRTNPSGVERPQLVINQFRSVNFFPTYIIDKLLNIHLFQNLYFLFQPIVIRPDNVARGRQSRSREFIRDGYYLLRLLITRSPQETNENPRIISEDQNNKNRAEINNYKIAPQFKDGHYITHVDTVIKTQANFANVYTPVQFNKQQLYYIGSRNRIILQMVPADPKEFKYNKLSETLDSCAINEKETKWKPFLDHDLITFPYAGPFNPQEWTNWNILQASSHLKTDDIIQQSEEGKKLQLFNMNSAVCNHNLSEQCEGSKMSTASEVTERASGLKVLEGLPIECEVPQSGENIDHCFHKNTDKLVRDKISPSLSQSMNKEIPVKEDAKKLKEFALTNSLKIIDLAKTDQRDRFIEDLNKASNALDKISRNTKFANTLQSRQNLLRKISDPDVREQLESDFYETCFDPIDPSEPIHSDSYQECVIQVLRDYLKKNLESINNKSYEDADEFAQSLNGIQDVESMYYPATPYFENVAEKLINLIIKPSNADSLERIVDIGIKIKNSTHPTVASFAHSLCEFWFDSYFKDYMSTKQMRAAHTNQIRKNDYNSVLNSNFSLKDKNSYFKEFLDLIPKDDSIKQCHEGYAQCLISDYCKERDHVEFDEKCGSLGENLDQSCNIILKKKCEIHPESHLCQTLDVSKVSSEKCHEEFKLHCETNAKDPLCYEYENRCLINYYDCTEKHNNYFEDLTKDDPLNTSKKEFFKHINKGGYGSWYKKHPLKTCLDNPYRFFNFENKVFVEEINNKHKLINGYISNFAVSSSISVGSYRNWTAQKSTGITLKSGVSAGLLTSMLGSITIFGANISMGLSTNESNSSRRARDVRLGEGVYLLASTMNLKIGVTKYKKCLTVKPRANAFTAYEDGGLLKPYDEKFVWNKKFIGKDFKKMAISQTGLVICNPSIEDKENPLELKESYYYITQGLFNANTSQFLNLYDIANRPFVIVLRGRREFLKMLYLIETVMEGDNKKLNQNAHANLPPVNQFIHYPHPVEEVVGLHLSMREFNETGFHEGIYTYPDEMDKLDAQSVKKKSFINKAFEFAQDMNVLPVPNIPNNAIPVQE